MPGPIDALLSGLFGRVTAAARSELDRYGRWTAGLVAQSRAWLAYGQAGHTCACRVSVHTLTGPTAALCRELAIGRCLACGNDVCLDHALVSPHAVFCFGCAEACRLMAQQLGGAAPAKPAKPKTRADHLRVLGLRARASAEEIKARYKKLALELHPDHASSDEDRARRHKRMVEVNAAYQALTAPPSAQAGAA